MTGTKISKKANISLWPGIIYGHMLHDTVAAFSVKLLSGGHTTYIDMAP